MTSRILYKARPGGNSEFFCPAAKRTVSRICPTMGSPGFIPDFLTVYFANYLGVLVITLVNLCQNHDTPVSWLYPRIYRGLPFILTVYTIASNQILRK